MTKVRWGRIGASVRKHSFKEVASALSSKAKRAAKATVAWLKAPRSESQAIVRRWREAKEAERQAEYDERQRKWEEDLPASPALMALMAADAPTADDLDAREAQMTAEEQQDEQVIAIFQIFTEFDKDGSGYIDAKELQKVLGAQGMAVTAEESKGMLAQMDDIEQDGLISFEEFYSVLLRQGRAIRSMADAVEALKGVRDAVAEEAREAERAEAKKRAKARWARAAELKRMMLVEHLKAQSVRQQEESQLKLAHAKQVRQASQNRSRGAGRARGRGSGRRGGGRMRGRAGSAAAAKTDIQTDTKISCLLLVDDQTEARETEMTIAELSSRIQAGAVEADTQVWMQVHTASLPLECSWQ